MKTVAFQPLLVKHNEGIVHISESDGLSLRYCQSMNNEDIVVCTG